jgi:hypothetical protein
MFIACLIPCRPDLTSFLIFSLVCRLPPPALVLSGYFGGHCEKFSPSHSFLLRSSETNAFLCPQMCHFFRQMPGGNPAYGGKNIRSSFVSFWRNEPHSSGLGIRPGSWQKEIVSLLFLRNNPLLSRSDLRTLTTKSAAKAHPPVP